LKTCCNIDVVQQHFLSCVLLSHKFLDKFLLGSCEAYFCRTYEVEAEGKIEGDEGGLMLLVH
jgi:hypothetical protein